MKGWKGKGGGGGWGWGGGKGGWGGGASQKGSWGNEPKPPPWAEADGKRGELLWAAVPEAVTGFAHLETEWDSDKLEKKIREYFTKAAKNIPFRTKSLQECVDEYTDNAIGSLFAGLGDREWLYKGQADFILVLDAGIKDAFPSQILWTAEQAQFEQMVLSSYERAFEEQRFGPALSEAVSSQVSGPKTKKKVWNALDHGRKEASASGTTGMEEFVSTWISSTVTHMSQAAGGSAETIITSAQLQHLFHTLVSGGGLPLTMTAEHGMPPSPWPLIDEAVQAAYAESEANAVLAEAAWDAQPKGGMAAAAAFANWAGMMGCGMGAGPPTKRLKGGFYK